MKSKCVLKTSMTCHACSSFPYISQSLVVCAVPRMASQTNPQVGSIEKLPDCSTHLAAGAERLCILSRGWQGGGRQLRQPCGHSAAPTELST